jgi:hypothetical protein
MSSSDSQYDPTKATALLDGGGHPRRRKFALNAVGGSLTVTVMKRAWEDCGIDYDDADSVYQIYLPDEGVVVIDLEGRGGDGGDD